MSVSQQIEQRYIVIETFANGLTSIIGYERKKELAVSLANQYAKLDGNDCIFTVIDRLARYGTTDSWDYRKGKLIASRIKLIPQHKQCF